TQKSDRKAPAKAIILIVPARSSLFRRYRRSPASAQLRWFLEPARQTERMGGALPAYFLPRRERSRKSAMLPGSALASFFCRRSRKHRTTSPPLIIIRRCEHPPSPFARWFSRRARETLGGMVSGP